MNNEPVAYINVEERKLEWAKPMTWHTPTIAQMDKIPLYTHPVKELTDEALKTFYEDRLEAGRKREETMMKTIEALLKKAQEK